MRQRVNRERRCWYQPTLCGGYLNFVMRLLLARAVAASYLLDCRTSRESGSRTRLPKRLAARAHAATAMGGETLHGGTIAAPGQTRGFSHVRNACTATRCWLRRRHCLGSTCP